MVKMIIVAPLTLKKDTLFEVEVNGRIYFVPCPRDVEVGESIEVDVDIEEAIAPLVPCDPLDEKLTVTSTAQTNSVVTVPEPIVVHEGSFKYGICGCIDGKTCCRPMWWVTWCIQGIAVAQLLNRFRWSPCALPTKMSRSTVFAIVVGMYLVLYICNALDQTPHITKISCQNLAYNSESSEYSDIYDSYDCTLTLLGVILYTVPSIIFIIILVILVRIRINFRKHYKIHGNCCADFCTMWCCSCCSIMQMLRQTHDEDEYKYKCCSCMTGLEDDAPEIV